MPIGPGEASSIKVTFSTTKIESDESNKTKVKLISHGSRVYAYIKTDNLTTANIEKINEKLQEQLDQMSEKEFVNLQTKKIKKSFNLNVIGPTEQLVPASSLPSSLQTLKGVTKFLDNHFQIPVSHQIDGSGSAIENCGYHALKNAFISHYVLNGGDKEKAETFFNDNKLFSEFYQTYCLPFVAEKAIGERDATPQMLRDITENFKNDPHPPESLREIQTALKQTESNFIIVNGISTSGNLNSSFFENEGILDTEKFYQFANEPGPSNLTLIFGDAVNGHWVTIIINKNEEGKLDFSICDSMEINHSRQLADSSFAKIVKCIQNGLDNPSDMILRNLENFSEDLERKASLIGTDDEARLLDYTSSSKPTESNVKPILEKCYVVYDIIKKMDLLTDDDIATHRLLSNVQTLMEFYSKKLEGTPEGQKCDSILTEIKATRGDSFLITSAEKVLTELEDMKANAWELEKNTYEQMKITCQQLLDNYNNCKSLADDPLALQRRQAAIQSEHKMSNPIKYTELELLGFLEAYQMASKRKELKEFCKLVVGGGCNTGRLGEVFKYITKIKWPGLNLEMVPESVNSFFDYTIGELLAELADDSEALAKLNIEQVKENKESLKILFTSFQHTNRGQAAREFLRNKQLLKESDSGEIDWDETIDLLLNSSYFPEMFSRGKAQASEYF